MPANVPASGLAPPGEPLTIAVVGGGIAGLSAAWLLGSRHRVTLYEAEPRLGGHAHTVDVPWQGANVPVDTGFIVYNEWTYPNLTALFDHLGVATKAADMSFAVSLDDGAFEYSGTNLLGLFAQRRNLVRPRFWSMLSDLVRFYARAPRDMDNLGLMSLRDYLAAGLYGAPFRDDHLLPMAAAIWSTSQHEVQDYPAATFIRFCHNHGLLRFKGRPVWRTVQGGSRAYVQRLSAAIGHAIEAGRPVRRILRGAGGVTIETFEGERRQFDHVVIATHADQALRLLAEPTAQESGILGAFRYSRNEAFLHRDARLMPRRRPVWSSWNYLSDRRGDGRNLCVTYWMNRLQGQPDSVPLFVTLNPPASLFPRDVIWRGTYEHPLFDALAIGAQERLWSLQGSLNTWFCGAYFGAGFHEDGLQAGLAVAEALGGVRRPWRVPSESGRIAMAGNPATRVQLEAA